jgi:hypothetical protein
MSFSFVTVALLDTSAAIFTALRALAFFRPIVKVDWVPENKKRTSRFGLRVPRFVKDLSIFWLKLVLIWFNSTSKVWQSERVCLSNTYPSLKVVSLAYITLTDDLMGQGKTHSHSSLCHPVSEAKSKWPFSRPIVLLEVLRKSPRQWGDTVTDKPFQKRPLTEMERQVSYQLAQSV